MTLTDPMVVRAMLLTAGLTPYVYFGLRDVLHHARHRPTPFAERTFHAAIGVSLATLVPHAYLGHRGVVVAALAVFIAARSVDEFAFHRRLPPAEVDLHAKTHLGFLIFIIAMGVADWYDGAHATIVSTASG